MNALPHNLGKEPSGSLRESFARAARFWERKRVIYNAVLALVVAVWLVATSPHFRPAMTLSSLLLLAILALLANVCYSAAYAVDIFFQSVGFGAKWDRRRWVLWLLGTLLAILFENYWIADEIYPFV